MIRFLLLSDCCGFVDVGRFLWREDGSAVYNYCWPSLAQSFLGPIPVGLVTIFYCRRFETSLFRSLLYQGVAVPKLNKASDFSELRAQERTVKCAAALFSKLWHDYRPSIPPGIISKIVTCIEITYFVLCCLHPGVCHDLWYPDRQHNKYLK
jgi:hypothetical protein